MMNSNLKLKIISNALLEQYLEQVPHNLQERFEALHEATTSTDTFSFYTSVASVFSSKIEGEDIEIDSYIKHRIMGAEFVADYTKKIDDLYEGYLFAQKHTLNPQNINKAHSLLSKNILMRHQQGTFRNQNMYVLSPSGDIEYVAASPFEVETEMQKLYDDIDTLLHTELNIEEVFYYAAYIHLVFVKIHPYNDGNGRCARLVEKWFVAQKLGPKAWFLQSEKKYYNLHNTYFHNIRQIGLEYPELDYSKALPFLLMLSDIENK